MEVQRSPLAGAAIEAAIEVHRELGPGLLESIYSNALSYEFSLRRIAHVRQVPVPAAYKGVPMDDGYRIDFIVEGALVLEIKAVEHVLPVHQAQLMTYMKLLKIRQGLLFNFHVDLLKNGIKSILL